MKCLLAAIHMNCQSLFGFKIIKQGQNRKMSSECNNFEGLCLILLTYSQDQLFNQWVIAIS